MRVAARASACPWRLGQRGGPRPPAQCGYRGGGEFARAVAWPEKHVWQHDCGHGVASAAARRKVSLSPWESLWSLAFRDPWPRRVGAGPEILHLPWGQLMRARLASGSPSEPQLPAVWRQPRKPLGSPLPAAVEQVDRRGATTQKT